MTRRATCPIESFSFKQLEALRAQTAADSMCLDSSQGSTTSVEAAAAKAKAKAKLLSSHDGLWWRFPFPSRGSGAAFRAPCTD
jgi:hypothetical protein